MKVTIEYKDGSEHGFKFMTVAKVHDTRFYGFGDTPDEAKESIIARIAKMPKTTEIPQSEIIEI